MKAPRVYSITVSPENIDEHLLKCKSNRSRTRKHVNTWVRAIRKGYFRDGGFIFADEKGFYNDGQHRLQAVKITRHTATFFVFTGVGRDSLNMMVDAGKKRTTQARMTNRGVARAPLIVGSIELIIELTERWKREAEMLLPDEVFAYYDNHRVMLDTLAEAWASSGIDDIPAKFLLTLQILFTEIDAEKSDKFFKDVTHRQLLREGEPLYAFFEMLSSDAVRSDTNRGRVKSYTLNGLIIAWNAVLKGQTLDHIEPTERPITLSGTPVASGKEEAEQEEFGLEEEPSTGNSDDGDDEEEA